LPSETGVCAVSGKMVDLRLLARSEQCGKLALPEHLMTCPETGLKVLPEELVRCEATGAMVLANTTEVCSATNQRVLRRLTVSCARSGRKLLAEKAASSARSGRRAHPDHRRPCRWTGQVLLDDEVKECTLSGLDFDSRLVSDSGDSQPLENLIRGKDDGSNPPDPDTERSLAAQLRKAGLKTRSLKVGAPGPTGIRAALADCSTFLGLSKKFAAFYFEGGDHSQIVGHVAVGVPQGPGWKRMP